jgi:hypothetical protein
VIAAFRFRLRAAGGGLQQQLAFDAPNFCLGDALPGPFDQRQDSIRIAEQPRQ